MKWIGQNIQDFISRFRNYVYIEKADASISTKALVVDEQGKIGINSAIAAGGVDSVTVGPAAVSSGVVTTIAPNVGSVIVTPNAYAGTTNVGHVPTGGGATTFLRGDATWVIPTDTIYTLPLATDTVRGGLELFVNTIQTVAASPVGVTVGRTYGLQLNSSEQGVINVPWTDTTGVTSFSNSNGTFVSNATVNTGAVGAVSLGRVDLTATGTPSTTTFLCGDNTWKAPIMSAHVTSFTNANGTFISAGTVNTAASGVVTVGTIDLSATGTPDASNFLCGDNTWKVPPYATGTVTAIGLISDSGSTTVITTIGSFVIAGGTNVTTSADGIQTVTINSTDQYTGTVTGVTGILPIDSSGGSTPAISIHAATDTTPGSVELATTAEAVTGTDTSRAVTSAGVKAAIDARYTYSYIAYSFRCSTTTDEEWFFPSDNGINNYQWTNRDAGSVAPSAIALASTIAVTKFSYQAGIFIPQLCEFDGFYGTVRMSNSLPNDAHPVVALFYHSGFANGYNSTINPTCIAFDTGLGSGSRLNRINTMNSAQDATLVAGSVIYPAFGQDAVLTSGGTAMGQITLKFKTLIP